MSTEGQHCVTGGPGWEDTCCLDSGGAHTLLPPHQTLVSPSGQWARRGSVLIQRAVSPWWRSTWRSRLGALQRPAGHPRSPVRSPLGSGYCACGLLVLICWDGKSLGVIVPSEFLEPRLLPFYLSLIWGSTKTFCLYSTGIIQHGSAFTPWAPKMEKPSRHSIEPCLGTLQ